MGYVYILSSANRRALYIGVTSNLEKRIWEHKNKVYEGFTSRYEINRLVYYEVHDSIEEAIAREKQLKKWSRVKKEWLINCKNIEWRDLSEEWF